MARDLILGKTNRDWSCGIWAGPVWAGPDKSHKQLALDVAAQIDSKKLGQLVREEIQKNYDTIVRLDTARRLPVVERKAFGVFMRKWVDFGSSRAQKSAQPVFAGEDVVALKNFREANRRFTDRLVVFDQMAKTPIKEPVKLTPVTSTEMTQFHPPGWQGPTAPRPWGWLISLGLGLAGLGFLVGKNR